MRKDPIFIKEQRELINSGKFTSAVVKHNVNAKWLIGCLAELDKPFRVVNLGGGVKRIILEKKVCPKCGGRGYC